MPREGEVYDAFPQKLSGVYVNVDEPADKLIIQEKEIVVDGMEISLCAGVELKYSDNYYVLNYPDSAGWTLYIGQLMKPGRVLIYGFDPDDKEKLELLQSITELNIVYNSSGEIESYQVNPSNAEFREILNQQAFTLFGEFERRD